MTAIYMFVFLIGGVIVIGKVWNKKRPVIIAKSESDTDFYFGVSHSENRKNMKILTPEGIEGLEIHENTCYGLCNKPSEIDGQIGTTTSEKDKSLIDGLPEKKIQRQEKRKK